MRPRVLVLNGGSSSGKSTLTVALQRVLPGSWLRFSVDTLVDACPPSLLAGDGLVLAAEVQVGGEFTAVEDAWMAGLALMAELGTRLLIEDNFVSGPAAQQRWRTALASVPAAFVGVRCPAAVAARRERARSDRTAGMAAMQAETVHRNIDYDLELDTARAGPDENAELVRARFFG